MPVALPDGAKIANGFRSQFRQIKRQFVATLMRLAGCLGADIKFRVESH